MTTIGGTRELASAPRRRSRLHGLFPPQHGAWAFLGLPLLLGGSRAGWSWLLVPLAVAWVGAYPLSHAATGLLSARRPRRFRRPAVVWAAVVAPPALVLVLARPWLLWVGVAYLALFAVNVRFARAHAERSLANDLVLVVECTAMVPLVGAVVHGGSGWWPPGEPWGDTATWVLTAVCALTLVGSTLHVKSLIRERRNPRFTRLSQAYALGCVPVAAAAGPVLDRPEAALLALPFAALAVRTFALPGRGWRPARVGLVDLAGFVAVAATAMATVA